MRKKMSVNITAPADLHRQIMIAIKEYKIKRERSISRINTINSILLAIIIESQIVLTISYFTQYFLQDYIIQKTEQVLSILNLNQLFSIIINLSIYSLYLSVILLLIAVFVQRKIMIRKL